MSFAGNGGYTHLLNSRRRLADTDVPHQRLNASDATRGEKPRLHERPKLARDAFTVLQVDLEIITF